MFELVRKLSGLILIIYLLNTNGNSQVPDTVEVSFHKSIYLFFKDEVTFDPGSEDIIVTSADKVLIVQARIENFKETNMMVQSGDKYYMFIIRFVDDIERMNYDYTGKMVQHKEIVIVQTKGDEKNEKETDDPGDPILDKDLTAASSDQVTTEKEESIQKKEDAGNVVYDKSKEEIERLKQKTLDSLKIVYEENCSKVLDLKQNVFDRGMLKAKMVVWATGIYVSENEFYLKLEYENNSRVNYDIDFEKFTVRNIRRGIKQYAKQIEETIPLYVFNDKIKTVKAGNKEEKIFVLKKFTIDKDRKLHFEIWEVSGERNIEFDLMSKDLLNVKKI